MKKIIQLLISIGCLFFLWPTLGQASELNFSVIPVIPETQLDTNKSYFDLKLEAGQEQELTVMLKNGTDQEVTVETSLNRATTNLNGVVEYGKTQDKVDSSLIHNIEDYIQIQEKEIKIPPQSEKKVTLTVKVPAENFKGVMTGGLTFKEKNATSKEEDSATGLAIKNEYAYVVGVVLHGTADEITPNVALNKVEAAQVNARNVINANLQNPNPIFVNHMAVDAKITKQNSKEVLYSAKKEDMQMAPNSNFNFPVALEGKALEPGKYTLTMVVTSLSDKWEFSKNFTITKETADKYNALDVSIVKDNTSIYIWIGSGILLIVALIGFFILRHRKKERKKELARQRRLKQKKNKRKVLLQDKESGKKLQQTRKETARRK